MDSALMAIVCIAFLIVLYLIFQGIFSKRGDAEKEERKLKENIEVAENLDIDVSDIKKALKDIENLKSKNPGRALSKAKESNKDICSMLTEYVYQLIEDSEGIVAGIVKQNIQAPPQMENILQQGIDECEAMLRQAQEAAENKDFKAATSLATNAKDVIIQAAENFNEAIKSSG